MIKSLDKYPQRPISESERAIRDTLMHAANLDLGIPPEVREMGQFQIIKTRNPLPACEYLIAFLGSLCSSPGICVQWAHTLNSMGSNASFEKFNAKFPDCLPTADAYLEAWEAQKDGGRNKLDTDEAFWRLV